jgi:DNA-directed RNA polymerase subunit RPC12/RpoP
MKIDSDDKYICYDCGRDFLTEKYSDMIRLTAVAHHGTCFICNKKAMITHIRHWNWLEKDKNKRDL